jgi:hypothetical protein
MHVCAGYDKGRPKQALPEAVAVKESGKVSNNTRVRRKGKLTGLDHQSGSDYRLQEFMASKEYPPSIQFTICIQMKL